MDEPLISPEWLRVGLLGLLVNVHQIYRRAVAYLIPESYLDEVFHIPQAQAYWKGRWSHWDNKITTPPALYGFSYLFNVIRRGRGDELTVDDLRNVNAILLYILLVALYIWSALASRPVNEKAILQKEFCFIMMPLYFFFSGLYYTDIFSALTIMLTYICWQGSVRWSGSVLKWAFQFLHLTLGLLSLASRQTNIFWVAIYLGGLQFVATIKKHDKKDQIHDPEFSKASIEDYFYFVLSLATQAVQLIPQLVLDLWPHLTLLSMFAAFVKWNGGVVLGDKSNHIATIHTPQLLYIWPCFVFFSWPALLPTVYRIFSNTPSSTLRNLPRFWTSALCITAMLASVHFNTIVHPFTLADNRHYVFYVFRILMRYPWLRYAVVPFYFVTGWLCLQALGGGRRGVGTVIDGTVHTSFVLIWLISTTLSLVTAPLVEPRYFMIPWLVWRLHVVDLDASNAAVAQPDPSLSPPQPEVKRVEVNGKAGGDKKKKKNKTPKKAIDETTTNLNETPPASQSPQQQQQQEQQDSKSPFINILHMLARNYLWIELAWYMTVNFVTVYTFLYKTFDWPQEPGKLQRFLW